MGYYDLYGKSYPTRSEAINAEIDIGIIQQEMEEMRNQRQEPSQLEQEVNDLQMKVQSLEQRIAELENIVSILNPLK